MPALWFGLLASAPTAALEKDVDFCIATVTAGDNSELVRRQISRMEALFAGRNWTYFHRPFKCEGQCRESYPHLNEKTYSLFLEAQSWVPRCRSLVKLDADGFMCLNRFVDTVGDEGMATLEWTYAGALVDNVVLNWPRRHALSARWRDAAVEVARKQWAPVPYAAGAAYLVGRQVMAFVTRQPLSRLLNITWEDMSVGVWTNAMEGRVVIDLSSDVNRCRHNRHVVHRCNASTLSTVCNAAPKKKGNRRHPGGQPYAPIVVYPTEKAMRAAWQSRAAKRRSGTLPQTPQA